MQPTTTKQPTTMQTKLTHHHLSAEQVNDQHGTAIMLTQQDGIEEPQSVLVHPFQLRPGLRITIKLPVDLTSKEAERLAGFIRQVPFDE